MQPPVIARFLDRLAELGMSQADFARAIKESPQTVQNWKLRGAIPANKIAAVARELRTSADWLLGAAAAPAVKEGHGRYHAVPARLIEAWSHLDEPARASLLLIAERLAKRSPK